MTIKCISASVVAVLMAAGISSGTPYQDAVTALNPTYYYHLDETTTAGGAVDSMGNAAPGTYNGSYPPGQVAFPGPLSLNNGANPPIQVPGAGGASNVSHFSNNQTHINLGTGTSFGANAMTVALFIKAGPSQGGDRIFTNNINNGTESFQITVGTTEGLVIGIDPSKTGAQGGAKTLRVPDNSGNDRGLNATTDWWHVIASTSGATQADRFANIKVWVNGVNRTANMFASSTSWGVETGIAKIGGRSASATGTQTHSGAQDEVAIWLNRQLTDAEADSIWQGAIVPEPSGLGIMTLAGCAIALLRRKSA